MSKPCHEAEAERNDDVLSDLRPVSVTKYYAYHLTCQQLISIVLWFGWHANLNQLTVDPPSFVDPDAAAAGDRFSDDGNPIHDNEATDPDDHTVRRNVDDAGQEVESR